MTSASRPCLCTYSSALGVREVAGVMMVQSILRPTADFHWKIETFSKPAKEIITACSIGRDWRLRSARAPNALLEEEFRLDPNCQCATPVDCTCETAVFSAIADRSMEVAA